MVQYFKQLVNGWLRTQLKYSSAVSGVFDPYTKAPTSAHILWTTPWEFGGVASYNTFPATGLTKSSAVQTYYTGSSQREEKTPPIIINGRLYYNQVDPPAYGFYCETYTTDRKYGSRIRPSLAEPIPSCRVQQHS